MSTIGIVLITGVGETSGSGKDFLGILFGLGAAVLYATVVLLNKFIKNVEGIHRTFLQFLSAIAVLIPYVALTGGMTLEVLDTTGWVCHFSSWYLQTVAGLNHSADQGCCCP